MVQPYEDSVSKLDLTGYYYYFSLDDFTTYHVGIIQGEISDGAWLLKGNFDSEKDKERNIPQQIVTLEFILNADAFLVFKTKEEFEEWWYWIDSPSKPNIIKLIKK